MTRDCDYCGTTYSRPPSAAGKFCSASCGNASRKMARTTTRRMRHCPGHPLAGKGGLLAEARAVLFDRLGPGPHPCHWCGKLVDWRVGKRGNGNHPDALVADHVNSDGLDDSPENIVGACGTCNMLRSRRVQDDELFIERGGTRHRAVERVCGTCDAPFLIEVTNAKAGEGKYCSILCMQRRPRPAKASQPTRTPASV